MRVVLPMYNACAYSSLTNVGKKIVHYTQQNIVIIAFDLLLYGFKMYHA